MKIQIKNRWDNVIYEYECENNNARKTVKNAVDRGAYLRDANLRDANLRDANLRGANLNGAYLTGAYLRDANLRDANLRDANLNGADLRGANLRDANLNGADLRGANLYGAYLTDANLNGANLRDANLNGADLRGANLNGANLRDANLNGADLTGAYLRDANLRGANLNGADLTGAYLRGAKIDKSYAYHIIPDFYILKMQSPDTKIKAWKYLSDDGGSPVQDEDRIFYEVGKTYSESKCDKNELELCSNGLNVATLQWCFKNSPEVDDTPFIEVEFEAKDIIAIPFFTDGKFRVSKLTVLRKTTRAKALKELIKLTKWNKYFKEVIK